MIELLFPLTVLAFELKYLSEGEGGTPSGLGWEEKWSSEVLLVWYIISTVWSALEHCS